jgi:H+/Cl- antiporter ClcA
MILEVIEYIPFVMMAAISAFCAYKLDSQFSYVRKINSKLRLKSSISALFYIGLMSLLMFLVPYVVVVKLEMTKYIAYLIMSVVCGICCYSAMDYRGIVGE